MSEEKFIVLDGTDEICIGGYGNDLGNKSLLKYSEKEIAEMIIANNNVDDNVRLANSLLKTIRNQENIIKEVREYIEENMKDSQLIFGINDINRLYVKNMNDILEILDKENNGR